jgi:hypothetical protein
MGDRADGTQSKSGGAKNEPRRLMKEPQLAKMTCEKMNPRKRIND